jgi:hypothetical protein
MHLIIYTSEFAGREEDINTTLPAFINDLKAKNLKLGITGSFFHHNLRFIHVLEGEKDSLESVMSTMGEDGRHKNIQRIIDQKIKKRGFMRWDMDSLNLPEDDNIDPDELRNIRDAYKRHLLVDSRILVDFYKAMLALHSLSPDRKYQQCIQ